MSRDLSTMDPETLSPMERLGCAFQPCNAGPGNSVLEGLEEEEEQQLSSLPPSASIPDQSRDGDTSLCQSQARAGGPRMGSLDQAPLQQAVTRNRPHPRQAPKSCRAGKGIALESPSPRAQL